jgi:hypothetical protein
MGGVGPSKEKYFWTMGGVGPSKEKYFRRWGALVLPGLVLFLFPDSYSIIILVLNLCIHRSCLFSLNRSFRLVLASPVSSDPGLGHPLSLASEGQWGSG